MLTGIYKSRTENILQLGRKEDDYPYFNRIKNYQRFQKILQVLHSIMHMQKKKKPQNDKQELIRSI